MTLTDSLKTTLAFTASAFGVLFEEGCKFVCQNKLLVTITLLSLALDGAAAAERHGFVLNVGDRADEEGRVLFCARDSLGQEVAFKVIVHGDSATTLQHYRDSLGCDEIDVPAGLIHAGYLDCFSRWAGQFFCSTDLKGSVPIIAVDPDEACPTSFLSSRQ
ncbi:MAG: hypothetical protein A3E87_00785 [Gammaproteobacteria bacterium RIFCSPHIGHO2_12_FULL_35_23]|nr:MAG: hypothetical protein A3E87_00785 [Gammaproteobacteria bacterium RIFCSPHIGHO2_12_FULL_35_23]